MREPRAIDLVDACERINHAGIARIANHPACADVFLRDGAVLTIWDSSEMDGRRWEITEHESGNTA